MPRPDPSGHQLFETACGFAAVAWSDSGITGVRLPAPTVDESRRAIMRAAPGTVAADPPPDVAAAIAQIARYFAGERIDFGDVPLALGAQAPLYARIYGVVRALRWGETTTYGAVAQAIGEGPETARAVGQAMARNPVPLIIPCHRVLAAGGRIGGFSAPGGSDAKVHMLALEGYRPAPPQDARQAGFGF